MKCQKLLASRQGQGACGSNTEPRFIEFLRFGNKGLLFADIGSYEKVSKDPFFGGIMTEETDRFKQNATSRMGVKYLKSYLLSRLVFVFFFSMINIFSSIALSMPKCVDVLSDGSNNGSRPLQQTLERALFFVARNKKEMMWRFPIEPCGSHCVSLASSTAVEFKVEVDSSLEKAEVHISSQLKALKIPSVDFLSTSSAKDELIRWLVGHELHPYAEPVEHIRYKYSQARALKAFVTALDAGGRSFLNVAPTNIGKTKVLAKAVKIKLRFPDAKKISFVTTYQINLVDQLYDEVRAELDRMPVRVLNWNDFSNKNFISEIRSAMSKDEPTVVVVTIQSLKLFIESLDDINFLNLALNLDGIYVDEVHHLGADHTFYILSEFLDVSYYGILFGTTATPTHRKINFRHLFDFEHWAYLDEDLLLPEHRHIIDEILDQLAYGIQKGEVTPFDDIYVIGEPVFDTKNEPLFINEDDHFYVLNPYHFHRLSQILSPILTSNKKGFIVTSTIKEANALKQFFNATFPDMLFETYHSMMSKQEREDVLINSKNEEVHYIVAVRALDEGVNLPHLSAYIDLNPNVSVIQMIHRIGRVLRLYPGKTLADILFLSDYKNMQMAKELLHLLELIEVTPFNQRTRKHRVGSDIYVTQDKPAPLSRDELSRARQLLRESAKKFWQQGPSRWMSYEMAKEIVQREGIKSVAAFYEWSKAGKRPARLPANPSIIYRDQGWKNWPAFLGTEWMSYEEAKALVQREGIKSVAQFLRWKDSERRPARFPASPSTVYKESGWKSWREFLAIGWMSYKEAERLIQKQGLHSVLEFYTWKESGKKPNNFPASPSTVYKNAGWKNWRVFLGIDWMSYDQAKKIIQREGVRSVFEFKRWSRSSRRSVNFPMSPEGVYKNSGWSGWNDFLGHEWMDYEDAKKFIQQQGIRTAADFFKWSSSGKRPAHFPSRPHIVYRESGWISWGEFLRDGDKDD